MTLVGCIPLAQVSVGNDSTSMVSRRRGHEVIHDLVNCNFMILMDFSVAYTKCVATLWHDRIYLFVHESRAPVTWSSKPHMYAMRTYFLISFPDKDDGDSPNSLPGLVNPYKELR